MAPVNQAHMKLAEKIVDLVKDHFNVDDISTAAVGPIRRGGNHTRARQVATYLVKTNTSLGYPMTALVVGYTDDTSALGAYRAAERNLQRDIEHLQPSVEQLLVA